MTSRDVEYIPTDAEVYSSDSGHSEELSGATATQKSRGTASQMSRGTASQMSRGTASQESRCAQMSQGSSTGTFPNSGLSQVIGDVSTSSCASTPTKLQKRRYKMNFGGTK